MIPRTQQALVTVQDTKVTEITVETTLEEVVVDISATEQPTYGVPKLGSTMEEAKKEITRTKKKKGVALALMTFPAASGDANWFHLLSFLLRRARVAKMEAVRNLRTQQSRFIFIANAQYMQCDHCLDWSSMKKEGVTPLPNVTDTLSLNVIEKEFSCVKEEDEGLNKKATLTTASLMIARNDHGGFEEMPFVRGDEEVEGGRCRFTMMDGGTTVCEAVGGVATFCGFGEVNGDEDTTKVADNVANRHRWIKVEEDRTAMDGRKNVNEGWEKGLSTWRSATSKLEMTTGRIR
ncbi:hypothetical protein V8G54_031600 [Vigna mungo]|uniref:Uncharacterized protein n=1 Tax=Vigna mungo TaxID=3915 RepID=A0AAQ3MK23_VIGMU